RSLPITLLKDKDAYDKTAEQLARMVAHQGEITHEAQLDGMYIALNELFSNVFAHAEAICPAVVCAEAYPKDGGKHGLIEVAIADTGIGLRNSLMQGRTRDLLKDGASACRLATQLGVTSKIAAHSGYGLWVVKEFVKLNGGSFKILSGKESLTLSGATERL